MKLLFTILAVFALTACHADDSRPYRLSLEHVRVDNGYQLSLQVTLDKGWWLYYNAKDIPVPYFTTTFSQGDFSGVMNASEVPLVINDPVMGGKAKVFRDKIILTQLFETTDSIAGFIPIVFHGFASDGKSFIPVDDTMRIAGRQYAGQDPLRIESIDINSLGTEKSSASVWKIFLLGLIGGLVALFTPCVFPMVPITVSFFTNRSANKRQAIRLGVLYGASILLIYLAASLPFHLLNNLSPELLNKISTSATVNMLFFLIFLLFALSFFGVFNIKLPSSLAGKSDSKSGVGSIAGVFFLALTLVIVSFSCTGPLLGSLLVGSIAGGAWLLTAGMAGFGVALGLPFAVFAVFPHALRRLPRAGSWMDTLKVVIAFIELALAFKFLSNVDLVMHWGILKREVFIGVWLVITLGLAWYLLDINWLIKYGRFKPAKARMLFGGFVAALALYLAAGLTGKSDLQALSGFPPPSFYSIYKQDNQHRLTADVVNDYSKALALAKAQNKQVLIDFTGWACVNCRKMEEQVWTKPEVAAYIKKHFVLVSLYVDDRQHLPADQQLFGYKTKEGTEKDIITVGDKWTVFQAENFSQVSQPLYAVLTTEQELKVLPVGYTPDVAEFLAWLEKNRVAE